MDIPNLTEQLDIFKRYELTPVKLIGVGGTSEVLLVQDETGKLFALKRLLGQYRNQRAWRDSILLEGVHLTMIQSNRVIHCEKVLTVPIPQALIKVSLDSDPSGQAYSARQEVALLLEYVEGVHLRALHKRIEQGQAPYSQDEVASIIWDVYRGMKALHEAERGKERPCPITHGDLSPTNIMIKKDGSAILIDLSSSSSELNMPSVIQRPGKAAYLSPGVKAGEDEGIERDYYALGCLWFELVTGHLKPLKEGPPAWRDLEAQGWPKRWAKLIVGLLSPLPQVRSQLIENFNRDILWGKDRKTHSNKRASARQKLLQRAQEAESAR